MPRQEKPYVSMPPISRPMRRMLLALLTIVHLPRLFGGSARIVATWSGALPSMHYLPGIGDALIGASAPAVALLLLRDRLPRTLRVANAWNLLGAVDLLLAVPINVLWRPEDPRFFTPVLATTFLVLHALNLGLLREQRARQLRADRGNSTRL